MHAQEHDADKLRQAHTLNLAYGMPSSKINSQAPQQRPEATRLHRLLPSCFTPRVINLQRVMLEPLRLQATCHYGTCQHAG